MDLIPLPPCNQAQNAFNDTEFSFPSGPNNCSFTACGLNCSDEIVAAATEPYGEDVCLYLW